MPDRDKMPYSLTSLLTTIVKQAQEDGRISAEESNLINRIQLDARELENEIVKARSEGNSSLAEIFNRAKENMIRNATAVAKEDDVITEDEEKIINKLISELEAVNGE